MAAFSRASGRDLDAWTVEWLDRAGTDTARPSPTATVT